MSISEQKTYPRTGNTQTIYVKNVINNPNILIGDYTMYNNFVNTIVGGIPANPIKKI